ncbi:MAG: tetratricopeptide repeat protein [Myxococcales bacterium]|nr:tetratricopeptide repeat protein [Myxococcales bacterium]
MRWLFACLVCLLIGPSVVAQAQDTPDTRARELFLQGDRLYAAGRYEEAAARFHEAHALSGRPEFLFNLANVYERMSEYGQAAEYLRRYLWTGIAKDEELTRQRLEQLERRQAEAIRAQALATQPAPIPAPARPEPSMPSTPADLPPRRRGTTTVALSSLTGAGTLSAVAFWQLSRREHRALVQRCGASGGPGICPADAQPMLRRERTFALTADATAVVAGGSAVVLVTHLLRRNRGRRAQARTQLTALPVEGGTGVALSHRLGRKER